MIDTAFRQRATQLLVPLALVCIVPANAQPDAYDILLTNDDGIESPGIQVLAAELAKVGRVHVVAPCRQRSGASMSVALRDDILLRDSIWWSAASTAAPTSGPRPTCPARLARQ